MANSFSILLSYIDNLLWGCTQLFYGIVFIFNFNYKLVMGLFRGIVQVWELLIQALINTMNLFVFSIEFLAELPVRSYHMGKHLLQLVLDLMNDGFKVCLSSSWASLMFIAEQLAAVLKNVGLAFISGWTWLFNLIVFPFTQLADLFTSLTETSFSHMKETKENTVHIMHSVGSDMKESLQSVSSIIYEYLIAGVTYPISILNACTKNMIDGLYLLISILNAIQDYVINIFGDMIELLYSGFRNITIWFYDLINTFTEIATSLIKVIDYVGHTLIDLFDSAAEGCFSLSSFIGKNWGALLALTLVVTLVWVTINMAGQHERNIQHIVQDLTRLVNIFTHSRPRDMNREQMRPEGHLHQDIHPEDQQQGDLNEYEGEANGNDGIDQDLPAGAVGGGDEPGPSRPRPTHHMRYSFRSRPFTPLDGLSEGNGSVEGILSDLKNRLSEEQERQVCVICMDAVKNTLFMPCRHLCVCLPCADTIVSNEDIFMRICPLCRTRIGSIVEVYS